MGVTWRLCVPMGLNWRHLPSFVLRYEEKKVNGGIQMMYSKQKLSLNELSEQGVVVGCSNVLGFIYITDVDVPRSLGFFLSSLFHNTNCWVDVWYCLSFSKPEMHIDCVMWNLCSAKKQCSFEKIEKIVLKRTLLLCTISKLLLRIGFACLLAYTVLCSNAGRRWRLWHLAQALYQINYSLLDLLHG